MTISPSPHSQLWRWEIEKLLKGFDTGFSFAANDLWFGVKSAAPRWVWNDKADGTGTDRMILDETGHLAVNTPIPANTDSGITTNARITLRGGIGFNGYVDNTGPAWKALTAGYVGALSYDETTGMYSVYGTAASAAAGATVTPGTLMTLDKSGNVAIAGNHRVGGRDVHGPDDANYLRLNGGSAAAQGGQVVLYGASSGNSSAVFLYGTNIYLRTPAGTPRITVSDASTSIQNTGYIWNFKSDAWLNTTSPYGIQTSSPTGSNPYVINTFQVNPAWNWCHMQCIHAPAAYAGWRLEVFGNYWDFRNGGAALKAGGGVWADTSDIRIKNVLGNYTSGLAEVIALRPVIYTFKGNDTDGPPNDVPIGKEAEAEREPEKFKIGRAALSAPYPNSPHYRVAVDENHFIGLVAQEAEGPMPELVTIRSGYIDGIKVEDQRDLQTGPLILALVNAVKELAAKVEALEAAR